MNTNYKDMGNLSTLPSALGLDTLCVCGEVEIYHNTLKGEDGRCTVYGSTCRRFTPARKPSMREEIAAINAQTARIRAIREEIASLPALTDDDDEEPFAWCNWCQERAAVEDDRDSLCEACAAEREERKIEAARDRYWDARIDEAREEVA